MVDSILATVHDSAVAVTPSDTVNDPAGPFSGLGCTTGGTITVTTVKGTKVNVSLVVGAILPIAVVRVWATGLGATGTYGCHAMPYKGNGQ